MSETPPIPNTNGDFYVGYLPIPASHRRFIIFFVLFAAIWSLGMATIITLTMRSPGTAQWNTGSMQTWVGTLIEKPYPMLVPDDPNEPALLVVEMGKRGAHERLTPYFNQQVQLQGYELNRDARRMIELDTHEDAITLASNQSTDQTIQWTTFTPTNTITTIGEIVDGKCYLGAMKPADGIGHRACAVLCIRGGLPPMFVTIDDNGNRSYALLLIDGSTTLDEHALKLVGQPCIITGQYSQFHGINIFHTTKSAIHPLKPSENTP